MTTKTWYDKSLQVNKIVTSCKVFVKKRVLNLQWLTMILSIEICQINYCLEIKPIFYRIDHLNQTKVFDKSKLKE